MIYGIVKNRVIKKMVRGALTPKKVWIEIAFNNRKAITTGWAMMKYYKKIGFYETRWNK